MDEAMPLTDPFGPFTEVQKCHEPAIKSKTSEQASE